MTILLLLGLALPPDSSLAVALRPIRLDGALDDWRGVPALAINRSDQLMRYPGAWRGRADASATVRLATAADTLYLALDVRDDSPLVVTRTDPAAPDWWGVGMGGDGAELLIRVGAAQTRLLLLAGPFGTDPRIADSGGKALPGARLAVRSTGAGYTMEAAVPFRAVTDLRPGRPAQADVLLHDWDGADARFYKLLSLAGALTRWSRLVPLTW